MLKRIPKSDISIRPFKAYKEWNFTSGSTEIDVLLASDVSSSYSTGDNLSFQQTAIYAQLKAQFYNGNENDPFKRVGAASLDYNSSTLTKDRFLSGSAKVISIPQKYIGEGVKKGSLTLTNGDAIYGDDTYGNIISLAGDTLSVGYIGIPTPNVASLGYLYFTDIANTVYSASIVDYDINTSIIELVYDGNTYDNLLVTNFNLEDGSMLVDNVPFLIGAGGTNRIGNIFYNQGIIALTRNSQTYLTGSWDLSYKSTQTIYENEYLLIVNQDEFNVSQNPSAIVVSRQEKDSFETTNNLTVNITTNPGVKYIRKKTTLENDDVLDFRYTSSVNNELFAGFEHYDLSGSVDSTGSFLAPFITTIGLYDDEMDLVAVAKLPQPIKSEPDIPVNFIVRFDT
jgi:hypothetical protein